MFRWPVLATTPHQDIVQYSDFNMSHVPVVIWLSLLVFVETVPFSLVSSACIVKYKTRLFCWDSDGTAVNSTSFVNAATLTSDGADHRERYEVDQDFSLIDSLQHFKSFDEGYFFSAVARNVLHLQWEALQNGQPLRWKTSKAMRCWTLEHPDQLEVT